VFEYPPGSKQLYKLTGSFAMVNQIVGRARRMAEVNVIKAESKRLRGLAAILFG
jgi:hypothetical protein